MQLLLRAHTFAALALIAAIPLVPLGLAAYAKAASVDRDSTVARNVRTFRSVPHVGGARSFGSHSYALYRWDVEGSLVPVSGYRTEFFLRLPHAVPARSILMHYISALPTWQGDATGTSVSLTRDGVTITVDTTETANGSPRTREYAFYVSQ